MKEIPTSEAIIDQFGLKHDGRFACVINAILNFTRIMANQSQGNPPEIYFHGGVNHAYILFDGQVLNGGVTAEKGDYKDFSAHELTSNGRNETTTYLGYALSSSGMTSLMKNSFSESTLKKAVPKMQQLYQHLKATNLKSQAGVF